MKAADVRVALVSLDRFHLPLSVAERMSPNTGEVGACVDWRRFRDQVLTPLRDGGRSAFGSFHAVHDRYYGPMELPTAEIVLCEGTYVARPELAASYDLRMWVECDESARRARTSIRDGQLGSRWRRYYEGMWTAEEARYVRETRPLDRCDLLVSGETSRLDTTADGDVRYRWLVEQSSLGGPGGAR